MIFVNRLVGDILADDIRMPVRYSALMQPGTQRTNLVNVLRFMLSGEGRARVLARKLRKRLWEGPGRFSPAQNAAWLDANRVDPATIANKFDPDLWRAAVDFGRRTRARAEPILTSVPFDMGEGGDVAFLYWLARYMKPSTIIETGVSAGWSSQAFLSALAENGSGRLYSSDFPYFRVKQPEQYIGLVVEPALKTNWELHVDGDENALPRILDSVPSVDLFHYDSDKSVSGREFAVGQVRRKLSERGIIIVDDIADNSWFREYVESAGLSFAVLGRSGLIGKIENIHPA